MPSRRVVLWMRRTDEAFTCVPALCGGTRAARDRWRRVRRAGAGSCSSNFLQLSHKLIEDAVHSKLGHVLPAGVGELAKLFAVCIQVFEGAREFLRITWLYIDPEVSGAQCPDQFALFVRHR